MKKNVVFLLLILIVTTCAREKEKRFGVGKTINIENDVDKLENGRMMFSKVEFLPLQENGNNLIGSVSKISIIDSSYYVLDKQKSKALYLYNNKGMPLNKFQRIGGSENEYVEIVDFSIDSALKEISVYCFPPKLIITDLSLTEIRKTISLKTIVADRMTKWNNLYYFYNHDNRIVSTYDVSSNEKKEILTTKKMKGDIINNSPIFFPVSGDLFFQSPGDESIYILEGHKFEPYINLEYNDKLKSVNFYQTHENVDISFVDRSENPLPYVWCIFEKENHVSFFYTFNFLIRAQIYEKGHYIDRAIRFFPTTEALTYRNNCLYSCDFLENVNVLNSREFNMFMKGVDIDYKGLKINSDFGNPVLVKYYLK